MIRKSVLVALALALACALAPLAGATDADDPEAPILVEEFEAYWLELFGESYLVHYGFDRLAENPRIEVTELFMKVDPEKGTTTKMLNILVYSGEGELISQDARAFVTVPDGWKAGGAKRGAVIPRNWEPGEPPESGEPSEVPGPSEA